jgi:hypothetical protein
VALNVAMRFFWMLTLLPEAQPIFGNDVQVCVCVGVCVGVAERVHACVLFCMGGYRLDLDFLFCRQF